MKKEIKPYYRYYASRLVLSIGSFSKVANLKNSYISMHLSLERGNYSRFLATLLPAVSLQTVIAYTSADLEVQLVQLNQYDGVLSKK